MAELSIKAVIEWLRSFGGNEKTQKQQCKFEPPPANLRSSTASSWRATLKLAWQRKSLVVLFKNVDIDSNQPGHSIQAGEGGYEHNDIDSSESPRGNTAVEEQVMPLTDLETSRAHFIDAANKVDDIFLHTPASKKEAELLAPLENLGKYWTEMKKHWETNTKDLTVIARQQAIVARLSSLLDQKSGIKLEPEQQKAITDARDKLNS